MRVKTRTQRFVPVSTIQTSSDFHGRAGSCSRPNEAAGVEIKSLEIAARSRRRVASSRNRRACLFELALSLLCEVQMLLNYLCRVRGKLFYVGIASAVCFFLELGQVLLMIADHHVYVSLV